MNPSGAGLSARRVTKMHIRALSSSSWQGDNVKSGVIKAKKIMSLLNLRIVVVFFSDMLACVCFTVQGEHKIRKINSAFKVYNPTLYVNDKDRANFCILLATSYRFQCK